ncbi:MAG: hypothetical protein N3F08_04960 [Crenarchaeota archaeon]|nr:hypothetical protein [Thermoproteota archaeon]
MRVEPRKTVEIDVVEEDLFIGRNSTIKAKTGEIIVVKGDVEFEGDCNILSSLHAKSLSLENRGRINVHGDLIVEKFISLEDGELTVSGRLEAEDVDVGKIVRVGKGLKCLDISVGGVLESEGDVDAESISIGGEASVRGNVKGTRFSVGGTLTVEGLTELERLDVGGTAKINGGKITNISVGGVFESTGKLVFEKLSVGGVAKLKVVE